MKKTLWGVPVVAAGVSLLLAPLAVAAPDTSDTGADSDTAVEHPRGGETPEGFDWCSEFWPGHVKGSVIANLSVVDLETTYFGRKSYAEKNVKHPTEWALRNVHTGEVFRFDERYGGLANADEYGPNNYNLGYGASGKCDASKQRLKRLPYGKYVIELDDSIKAKGFVLAGFRLDSATRAADSKDTKWVAPRAGVNPTVDLTEERDFAAAVPSELPTNTYRRSFSIDIYLGRERPFDMRLLDTSNADEELGGSFLADISIKVSAAATSHGNSALRTYKDVENHFTAASPSLIDLNHKQVPKLNRYYFEFDSAAMQNKGYHFDRQRVEDVKYVAQAKDPKDYNAFDNYAPRNFNANNPYSGVRFVELEDAPEGRAIVEVMGPSYESDGNDVKLYVVNHGPLAELLKRAHGLIDENADAYKFASPSKKTALDEIVKQLDKDRAAWSGAENAQQIKARLDRLQGALDALDGENFKPVSVAVSLPDNADNTLHVGQTDSTVALKAVVAPETASQEVKWSSSDPQIATVDENTGKVTAVGAGNVTITATSKADESVSGNIELKVVKWDADAWTDAHGALQGKEHTFAYGTSIDSEALKNLVVDGNSLPEGAVVSTEPEVNTTPDSAAGRTQSVKVKVTFADGSTLASDQPVTVTIGSAAESLEPVFTSFEVNLGDELTSEALAGAVSLKGGVALPEGTKVGLADGSEFDSSKAGEHSISLVVTYPDGSTDTIEGAVIKVVDNSEAGAKTPQTEPITVTYGGDLPDLTDAITNKSELGATSYKVVEGSDIDTTKPGNYEATVEVTYSDGSKDTVKIPVVVKKASESFALETKPLVANKGELPEASSAVSNLASLPKGTVVAYKQTPDVAEPTEKPVSVIVVVTFPDGSSAEAETTLTINAVLPPVPSPEPSEPAPSSAPSEPVPSPQPSVTHTVANGHGVNEVGSDASRLPVTGAAVMPLSVLALASALAGGLLISLKRRRNN